MHNKLSRKTIEHLRKYAIRDRNYLHQGETYIYVYAGDGNRYVKPFMFVDFGFIKPRDIEMYKDRPEIERQVFSLVMNFEGSLNLSWKFLSDGGVEKTETGYLGVNFIVTENNYKLVIMGMDDDA